MSTDTERLRDLDTWADAIGPWRPKALPRPEPALPRRHRAALLALVLVLHLGGGWLLTEATRGETPVPGPVTTLVFISDPPVPVPPPSPPEPSRTAPSRTPPRTASPRAATPPVPSPARSAPAPAAAPAPSPAEAADTAPAPGAMVAVEVPAGRPLRLFDSNGSLALPDDVVARLEDVDTGPDDFDFQQPGLLESGRFMARQPVLVYEPTVFDRYWRPEQDVLTEILEKAVELGTATVEIPIPGSPGSKLVCGVSVLALGGGCGIRNNNQDYTPVLDDPATLSPEEEAQCRAWWERIAAAATQQEWRETRALYDHACRKPPARDDTVPLHPADP